MLTEIIVRLSLPVQRVDATHALNLSTAGSNSNGQLRCW